MLNGRHMSFRRRGRRKNGEISGDDDDDEGTRTACLKTAQSAEHVSDHSVARAAAGCAESSTSFLASLIIFRIAGKQKQP